MNLYIRSFYSALLVSIAVFSVVSRVNSEVSALSLNQNGNGEVTIVCKAPDISLTQVQIDGQQFRKIDAGTDGLIGVPGGPAVPSWSKWIEVPDGMNPQLEISSNGEEVIHEFDLAPFPTDNDNPNITDVVAVSQTAYASDTMFPSQAVTVSDQMTIGNKRYALVDVSPYRYNPARRELTIIKDLQVNVTFQSAVGDEQTDNRNQFRAPVWDELDRAIGGAPPRRDDGNTRHDILGHYVIVTADREDLIEAVQPLVDWKQRKGYKVTVANIGDIGNSAEALKGWLQDAYDEWDIPPTFVLLTGDARGQGSASLPYFTDNAGVSQSWASSDNQFVCWDGLEDDRDPEKWIPEGFIGRLPARDARDLGTLVEKIIGYEANPYTDEPWVEGAVLIANGVRSCEHANIAVREIMEENGYERGDIVEAYADYHTGQRPNRNQINQRVDAGLGFVNFRGYNNWGDYYGSQGEITSRRNGWKMPIVTGMVCGTNDFPNRYTNGGSVGEAWLRTTNNPAGAVATYGPTDLYTHTWFNNPMDAEFYHVLFNKGVKTLGAAVLASKLTLLRNYPSLRRLGDGHSSGYYFYTYTLLGDPGMQVWTHDPKSMTVDFTSELAAGATFIEVSIVDEDEVAIEGAYVHIFRSSEDGEARFGAYSDEEGMVRFSVAPLEAGEYKLTVTGPNLVPVMESIDVDIVSLFTSLHSVAIDDDMNDDSNGNGDGEINPGETIELSVNLRNSGDTMCEESVVTLSSNSEWVEVTRAQVDYPSIRPDEDSIGGQPFLFRCLPGAQDGEILDLIVTVQVGEILWQGSIGVPVIGYEFELIEFELSDELYPGTEQELTVYIQNVGNLDSDQLTATLTCEDVKVQIRRADSPMGELESGESSNNGVRPFVIFANENAYQGTTVPFVLTLHDRVGRIDKQHLSLTLGEPTVDSPQGPDKYGYWAFDTRDESSGMAPEYDWVSGRNQLNGLIDRYEAPPAYSSHQGSRAFVDLPFEFSYYGSQFSEITVGSNGWLCFGRTDLITWNNQEIGSPLGPRGMLCPYWNDLFNGSVYTYYDEDNARFIVEWRGYQVSQGGEELTFAVQLFDPTVVSTATGDGEIHFLYESNLQGMGMRDYADEATTIGISSPDRGDGISITHARQWDPRTADLDNDMTIRFTTGELTTIGSVEGRVFDIQNGNPLEGARVMIEGTGFFSNTDQNGAYVIDRIPEGSYTVKTYMLHYNEASAADIEVVEAEATQVNFRLTHPTFEIDIEEFDVGVEPDTTAEESFSIWNEGNGDLDYSISLNPVEDRDENWEVRFDFDASAQADGDRWLRGVTYDGENFYVVGRVARSSYPHKIYIFNDDGELTGDIDQFTVDSSAMNGYNEIEWNGTNFYAAENGNIIEITPEGDLVGVVVETDEREIQNLCWSPDRETIFAIPRRGDEFMEFDTDGNMVNTYSRGNMESLVFGLSWFPADKDGYNLYIFTDPEEVILYGTRLEVHKMNVETGDIQLVNRMVVQNSDKPQGCVITKKWDPLTWTFAGLVNNPDGDRVVGWEIAPNFTWITYDPPVGTVQAGDRQDFTVMFLPDGMPNGNYNVVMDVMHNAVGDQYRIPVHFNIGPQAIFSDDAENPTEFRFNTAYPNPFNPTTRLSFNLPIGSLAELTVWDVNGRLVEQMDMGNLPAGNHQLQFNAENLAGGIYFARITAGQHSATQKLLLLR